MLLVLLLKKFNYTINIYNSKKFINAYLHAIEQEKKLELAQIKKEFEEIEKKIKKEQEKRLQNSLDDLDEFDR